MPTKAKPKHLDTREIIAPNLVLKYHSARPPDDATRRFLRKSVGMAGRVMRSTVWEVDKIVLFHRDESQVMSAILDKHFCLNRDAGYASTRVNNKLVNSKNRRRFLGKVRKVMLSVSFHLSTGVYLLDVDAGHRTIVGDFDIDALDAGWKQAAPVGSAKTHVVSTNIEGYVQKRDGVLKTLGGSSSGPIHVAFDLAKSYSPEEMARIIIHEATHTFCYTLDVKYCHDANYDFQTPDQMLTNADSFAYAAMSIAADQALDYQGLKNLSLP